MDDGGYDEWLLNQADLHETRQYARSHFRDKYPCSDHLDPTFSCEHCEMAESEGWTKTHEEWMAIVKEKEEQLDSVYEDRNRVVQLAAVLARHSTLENVTGGVRVPIQDEDWPVVVIQLAEQDEAAWHIPRSECIMRTLIAKDYNFCTDDEKNNRVLQFIAAREMACPPISKNSIEDALAGTKKVGIHDVLDLFIARRDWVESASWLNSHWEICPVSPLRPTNIPDDQQFRNRSILHQKTIQTLENGTFPCQWFYQRIEDDGRVILFPNHSFRSEFDSSVLNGQG